MNSALVLSHGHCSQPAFGVLSTLASVKYDKYLRFTVARIILDFVQLLLLVLRPAYGEHGVNHGQDVASENALL